MYEKVTLRLGFKPTTITIQLMKHLPGKQGGLNELETVKTTNSYNKNSHLQICDPTAK